MAYDISIPIVPVRSSSLDEAVSIHSGSRLVIFLSPRATTTTNIRHGARPTIARPGHIYITVSLLTPGEINEGESDQTGA